MQPNQGHSTICPRVPESQSPKPPHCRLGSRPRLLHRWPGTGLEVCTQVRGLEDGDSRIKMQYLLLNQRYPPLPNIAHLVHNRGISGLPCFPTRLSSSHSLEAARDYWLPARGAGTTGLPGATCRYGRRYTKEAANAQIQHLHTGHVPRKVFCSCRLCRYRCTPWQLRPNLVCHHSSLVPYWRLRIDTII